MSGWDEGNVFYSDQNLGEDNEAHSANTARIKFREFIRDYRDNSTYIYRDQLRSRYNVNQFFMEINLDHLLNFDAELADDLQMRPNIMLPLFETAAKEAAGLMGLGKDSRGEEVPLADIQISLHGSKNPVTIRDLVSSEVSRCVQIPGIISQASRPKAKATSMFIMCKGCQHSKTIAVSGGFGGAALPRTCDRARMPNEAQCPIDPFIIVSEKSKYIDQQTLRLQESPDSVPTGEMPRSIRASVDRHLVGKVKPGDRVIVTAVFSINQQPSKDSRVAIRDPYLRVVGLKLGLDAESGILQHLSPEEEQQLRELSREPDIASKIARSIAPALFGHEDVKKSIASLLFGGSRKRLPDGARLRGDVNVLMLGDPSLGKSQFLKFVEKAAPVAVYTSGKGSSAAGLTASVTQEQGTREFYIEAGAMVLADGGVVCIDEFDKMREQDRVAIHEAMEQQTISIAKAGITTTLNSRTSVLAAANPKFGRFDDMKSSQENVDFQSTILSRFDMIFVLRDTRNEAKDKVLAQHILNVHQQGAQGAMQKEDETEIPVPLLRKYVAYARKRCAPRLSEEGADALQAHYVNIRGKLREKEQAALQQRKEGNESFEPAFPITVRQLEALVRISESLAKMELADDVTSSHVEEAMRLFQVSTLASANAGEIHMEGMASEEVQTAERIIMSRIPSGQTVSTKRLQDEVAKQGIPMEVVERALKVMSKREDIRFLNQGRSVKKGRAM